LPGYYKDPQPKNIPLQFETEMSAHH